MMRLLLTTLLLVACPVLIDCSNESSVTTYNLFYDGTLALGDDASSPDFVSIGITSDILQSYFSNGNVRDIKEQDCRCNKVPSGVWCTVDFVDETILLHVSAHFFNHETRIDASLTASPESAREALVQSVPKLSKRLDDSAPVWSIRHRPTVVEMKTTWDDSNSVVAAQHERDVKAASVETMILDNAEMRNRTRIVHDGTMEIWQYDDVDFVEPVKAMFIDGILQTTTAPASAAHAEALVHPALTAHENSTSVLVISRTPSAIVREVLKHESVKHVSVVGAEPTAMNMIEKHMASLCDCSFLGNDDPNCFHQEQVNVVDMDFEEWIEYSLALIEEEGEDALDDYYDVILVDVPIGTQDWISLDLYRKLENFLVSYQSIFVISSGSRPSLFEVNTETELSARDSFLRWAARGETQGGLDYSAIHLYDEPLAHPLSSTFITLFFKTGTSYARFIRKNSPMIDNDLVSRLRPGTRTAVYDGPTHKGYMITSRTWENWYCNTIPGRNLPICQSFLQDWMDASFHHRAGMDVRKDPIKGRTMYATEYIPEGHFINPQDAALAWRLEQDQWQALDRFVEDYSYPNKADMYRQLRDFILAYGFEQQTLGIDGWGVAIACTNTFINHACSNDEENVDCLMSAYESEDPGASLVFSPPFVRRSEVLAQLTVASKDIHAGDEILQDYSTFRTTIDDEYKLLLQSMCQDGVGLVVDDAGGHGDEL